MYAALINGDIIWFGLYLTGNGDVNRVVIFGLLPRLRVKKVVGTSRLLSVPEPVAKNSTWNGL